MKIENLRVKINLYGQYENLENYEWCEISDEQRIPKFANFRFFYSFLNWKNSENFEMKN